MYESRRNPRQVAKEGGPGVEHGGHDQLRPAQVLDRHYGRKGRGGGAQWEEGGGGEEEEGGESGR